MEGRANTRIRESGRIGLYCQSTCAGGCLPIWNGVGGFATNLSSSIKRNQAFLISSFTWILLAPPSSRRAALGRSPDLRVCPAAHCSSGRGRCPALCDTRRATDSVARVPERCRALCASSSALSRATEPRARTCYTLDRSCCWRVSPTMHARSSSTESW